MPYSPLPLPELSPDAAGLSEKAMTIHHDKLYVGYVNKRNELEQLFPSVDLSQATNATYSVWREAKLEETFAANGVVLHEHYFASIAGAGGVPTGALADKITTDFGSIERWQQEFMASGFSSRGWVVLAWDLNTGKLHNYLCDGHHLGGVWGAIPLLVLDVYEHAYFIDFGSDRKSYLEYFMRHINWSTVERRFADLTRRLTSA